MSIQEKLLKIQRALKAPKGQRNTFGNYNFRSCEDIFEAVKPLCEENKVFLKVYDDLAMIGDRYYIKSTAEAIDIETLESESVTAWAREEQSKKGMDESQVTGASSSYARKYALNGLFCIDDVKDSDATSEKSNTQKVKSIKSENKPLQTCQECGKQVAETVAKFSQSKYKKVLCMTCQKKEV